MKILKNISFNCFVIICISCFVLSCNNASQNTVGAGFRYSAYGPEYNPGKEYWKYVGEEMASKFKNSNPEYRLFLKHWLIEKMPLTVRKDIVFINDSRQFKSLDEMLTEFKEWGKAFEPAEVGFQYGYPADRKWWGEYKDPAKQMGQSFIENIPNTSFLFWVDFTVIEVFPPGNNKI